MSADIHQATIVDCTCGLRYLRTSIHTALVERGESRCICGDVLGAWDGPYRFMFEAEDETQPPRGSVH